jgi:hypothetical protein
MKPRLEKWVIGPILLFMLLWAAFPWIMGAVGLAAHVFGFELPRLPDWPIMLYVAPILLALAWGVFMGVVEGFTGLLRWLHSRPVLRLAEWWLALSDEQRIRKTLMFLAIAAVAAVFIWVRFVRP